MSMSNDSATNNKLIALIESNLINCELYNRKKVSCLYNTILNNTILKRITEKTYYETLTCQDSINHHGAKQVLRRVKLKSAEHNMTVAIKLLRQLMPYSMAKRIANNIDNATLNDALYHVINDFKYKCNSNFYTMFKHD